MIYICLLIFSNLFNQNKKTSKINYENKLWMIFLCTYQSLSTMFSVNFSNWLDFSSLTVSFGLMLLLFSLTTFSDVKLVKFVNPFLLRICDILVTIEIVSPIPSIWTVPCFLRMTLHKNNPSLSLESLRTL